MKALVLLDYLRGSESLPASATADTIGLMVESFFELVIMVSAFCFSTMFIDLLKLSSTWKRPVDCSSLSKESFGADIVRAQSVLSSSSMLAFMFNFSNTSPHT